MPRPCEEPTPRRSPTAATAAPAPLGAQLQSRPARAPPSPGPGSWRSSPRPSPRRPRTRAHRPRASHPRRPQSRPRPGCAPGPKAHRPTAGPLSRARAPARSRHRSPAAPEPARRWARAPRPRPRTHGSRPSRQAPRRRRPPATRSRRARARLRATPASPLRPQRVRGASRRASPSPPRSVMLRRAMPPYSLDGKTLFITGGANGIGAEVARQASVRGAKLALVDVDGDAAARTAASLPNAIGIAADVRDYDALEAAVQETVQMFGGIDVVMANAGIEISHTAQGVPLIEMERLADINFTGVFRTVRAALPHVVERRGYVLITASLAAIAHAPPLSHYAASKAGVEAFGNAIRLELRHNGVDVGVAYFGFIDTPMVQIGKSDPLLAQFEAEAGRNPIGKTYPVSAAGAAVIAGIEARSRRVMYPRFIRGLYALRSLVPRFLDRAIKADLVARLCDAMDERDRAGSDASVPTREYHERMLSGSDAERFDARSEEENRLLS